MTFDPPSPEGRVWDQRDGGGAHEHVQQDPCVQEPRRGRGRGDEDIDGPDDQDRKECKDCPASCPAGFIIAPQAAKMHHIDKTAWWINGVMCGLWVFHDPLKNIAVCRASSVADGVVTERILGA